jgi:hypothetical protein
MKGRTARERRRTWIFERDGHRCVYCGGTPPVQEMTVDHVEPRAKGGDHSAGNLVACCRPCNRLKGGRAAWLFLAAQPQMRANFLANATGVWPRLRRAVEEAARD